MGKRRGWWGAAVQVVVEVMMVVEGDMRRPSDGHHGGSSLKDDPLQVPDGPITRSRANKIKEAMQGLVQSTWAEFTSVSSKTPTFNMGLKGEEPALTHLIQAT